MRVYRARVNAPSKNSQFNKYHWMIGIVMDNGEKYPYIYFTEGVIRSTKISRSAFSEIHFSNLQK